VAEHVHVMEGKMGNMCSLLYQLNSLKYRINVYISRPSGKLYSATILSIVLDPNPTFFDTNKWMQSQS